MRQFYTLIISLILPFLPLRLLWRSRKNQDYRKNIGERFALYGFYPLAECIWVHAVSVGEAIAAIPLIRELRAQYPTIRLVVTTMTPTGAERIRKTFHDEVLQLYVPYDHPWLVQRFLRQVKPRMLILMETELWPNILYCTAKKKIPILIANARLSQRSFAGYKKAKKFFKPLFECVTTVAAQTKLDAERFHALGVDAKKIVVMGNMKFDISVPENICQQAQVLRDKLGKSRPIWIAASTHQGEEEKVLTAAAKVLEALPNALLILVPRHCERFDTVYELCSQRNFKVVRYSKEQKCTVNTSILLGDVMGQLLLLYAVADVAFVGGSLIEWGGHNLLEPAALAKPVLTGPNVNAFLEVSQLLEDANAVIKVADENALAENIIKLLQNVTLREKLGTAALDVVEQNRGVTNRIMQWVNSRLSQV